MYNNRIVRRAVSRAARRARLARQDVLEGGRGRLGGGKVCRRRHAPRGERDRAAEEAAREQRNQQLDDPRLGWAGVGGLRRGKAVDAEGVGTSRMSP